jgi:hypothetical protein
LNATNPKWEFYGDWIGVADAFHEMRAFFDFVDDGFRLAESSPSPDDYIPLPFDRFREVFYESIAITSIVMLERGLTKFVDKLQIHVRGGQPWEDKSKWFLKHFQECCKETPGVDIDFEYRLWPDLNALKAIRNCIVHENRDVTRMNDRRAVIERYVKENPEFAINDGCITFARAGAETFVVTVETALLHVNTKAVKLFGASIDWRE